MKSIIISNKNSNYFNKNFVFRVKVRIFVLQATTIYVCCSFNYYYFNHN